jgi:hypothetical protein
MSGKVMYLLIKNLGMKEEEAEASVTVSKGFG